jgi:hypothetical protein
MFVHQVSTFAKFMPGKMGKSVVTAVLGSPPLK